MTVPVGLAGLARISPAGGLAQRVEHVDGRLEPRLGAAVEFDDAAAERGERVAVGGIAGPRQHYRVARVECGEEDQRERAGRPRGDDDVVRADVDPGRDAMMLGDGLAQLEDAERLGVAEHLRVEGEPRSAQHRLRGGRRGLAGGEREDVSVGAAAFGRGLPHVHDVERLDHRALRFLAHTTNLDVYCREGLPGPGRSEGT